MAITFSCSGCANVLKVADTLVGRKGKCPRCGAVNVVPPAGRIQSTPPPPKPAAKTVIRKVKPVEPEEFEIDENDVVEEEDVLEEEDVVEEEEDRPRKRGKKQIDEDDRVEETDETEEEEDRPRKRSKKKGKKKKKKEKSRALLISLIVGGIAFLFLGAGGVGGVVWWKYFSGSSDDLKYMPDNSQFVATIRINEMVQSDVFKELKRELPEINQQEANMSKEMGLTAEDLESITVGGRPNSKELIVVLRTKKAMDSRDLQSKIKNAKYTETKVGKYVVQESQDSMNPTYCLVDKKLLVCGEKEPVRAVLTRDKKPVFSKNLQAALKKADFSKTLAVAVDLKSSASQPAQGGNGLPLLGDMASMSAGMDKIEALAFQAKIGSDVRLDLVLLCPDAKIAEDVKKSLTELLGKGRGSPMVPKELGDLFDIPIKTNGSDVTASKTIKVSPLIKTYKQKGGNP